MPPRRAILLGRCLTIASLTLFVVSGLFMALRVSDYYKANPPPRHLLQKIDDRNIAIWEKPLALADTTTPDGHAALHIAFGDTTVLFPCHRPKAPGIKDLDGYEDWLALVAFAPMKEGRVLLDPQSPESAASDLRLVLVSRNAAPGHDDDMGGLVGRKLWTFTLLEFHPDGTTTQREVQFPAYKFTTGRKYLPAEEADPETKVEPIEERSWEFQVALLAIPKLHISNYRYRNTGVNAMGWTLPGTGFGMMGVIGGIVLWQGGRIGLRRPAFISSRPVGTPAAPLSPQGS